MITGLHHTFITKSQFNKALSPFFYFCHLFSPPFFLLSLNKDTPALWIASNVSLLCRLEVPNVWPGKSHLVPNGPHLCSTPLVSDHSKCFTTQVNIHPITHTFTHHWQEASEVSACSTNTHSHPDGRAAAAIWTSVSCPRTLWLEDWQIETPTFLKVEQPLYLLSHSRQYVKL